MRLHVRPKAGLPTAEDDSHFTKYFALIIDAVLDMQHAARLISKT